MLNLKYKFRIYPSDDQLLVLNQITGACRFVYNYFLEKEKEYYELTKKFHFYNQNSADLTQMKKQFVWLNLVPAVALQQSLRNLDFGIRQTFKKNNHRKGFPRFKSKKNFESSFTLTMVSNRQNVKDDTFYIPKVGYVKCKYTRQLPSDFASCQVKQEAGKWFVVLTVSKEEIKLAPTGESVGIDLNSERYVFSDETEVVIPKYLKESQFKIRRLQKSLSRKKKGSCNRKKVQRQLARAHYTVKMKRLDFAHKLTTNIIRKYDLIFLEDLNVVGIQKFNGHIIKDNIFAMFRSMLEYKGLLYGRTVACINRYFPSSKTCNSCGAIKDELKLSERLYVCEHCGHIEDRDLNAAKNIKTVGLTGLVCGENVSREAIPAVLLEAENTLK